MRAVEMGHGKIAEVLLQNGADANAAEPDGWTALRTAAVGRDVDAARLLVRYGAELTLSVAP